VLKSGSGSKSPAVSDKVSVHYKGTLINGKEFDSSIKKGRPSSFGVGQVIAGWTEGLQLMKEGDEFEFYIPSELAYGKQGAAGVIPADSALIFFVQLLKIN